MNPGIYRRRIRIITTENEARADLEDDLHRFAVTIRHDGMRVSAIQGQAIRVPWSLCPQALMALDRLVGMPLAPHPLAVYRQTLAAQQCTHLFDLAGLAIAHAARGIKRREYEVEAPYLQEHGPRSLCLRRDGSEILHWTLDEHTLTAPPAFAGQDVRRLSGWAEEAFPDPDDYEAIVILRRAILISRARLRDWDIFPTAADTGHVLGACYVFQEGVHEHARRMLGSSREFSSAPELLLNDLPSTNTGSSP